MNKMEWSMWRRQRKETFQTGRAIDEKDTEARESGKQENAGNSGFLNHSL